MAKTFILTDDSVNSYGFKIDMDKLNLDRFKSNPVMLYNHNELVGRWDNIRLEDGKLLADSLFMDQDGEELSAKVQTRVDNGFVKGASIGFHILNVIHEDDEPPKVEAEIYECSVCDIPSNQNSVVLYTKEGVKLEGDAFKLAINTISEIKNTDMNKYQLSAENLTALSLQSDATGEAVNTAVHALAKSNAELKAKLKTIEKEKSKSLITTALSEGRINAENQKDFENLADENFELAQSTIAALPKKKTLSGQEEEETEGTEDRSNWTFKQWREKDTAGLLSIKKDDPDRYAKIVKKS